jgi:alpha-1,2-mannosyltransferase
MIHHARRGDWLGRDRVIGYGAILLILEVAAFLFIAAGTHGAIVRLDKPNTTDFASFYAAGMLADEGTPALAYDKAAHYAAEQRVTEPGIQYQYFYYPPVFLMLCAAVARLPYLPAFVLFETVPLLVYLMVARAILQDRSWRVIVPLLSFPAVAWTIGLGQNAFISAALFGAATMLVDRRPIASGLLFGALCYKPHFGLLVPVALAAGRHGRAFAAAVVSLAALVLASWLWFGGETWHSFLVAFAGSDATYTTGRIDFAAMVTPFGGVRLVGGSVRLAYALQAAAALLAAGFVAFVWLKRISLPVRAATLLTATLLAVPLSLFYDLMLAAIAMLWLIRAGRETGYLPWEKLAFGSVVLVALLGRSTGDAFSLPLGPLCVALLLACAVARAAREIGARTPLDSARKRAAA